MPLFLRKFSPSPSEIEAVLSGPLHPKAIEGIRLFNAHEYWEAHESLETAWLEESSVLRGLYKGILQAGVLYLQIERQNLKGAMKMYQRSQVWLSPWPEVVRGIAIGKLRRDVEAVKTTAQTLGKDRLDDFDSTLFKSIEIKSELYDEKQQQSTEGTV